MKGFCQLRRSCRPLLRQPSTPETRESTRHTMGYLMGVRADYLGFGLNIRWAKSKEEKWVTPIWLGDTRALPSKAFLVSTKRDIAKDVYAALPYYPCQWIPLPTIRRIIGAGYYHIWRL